MFRVRRWTTLHLLWVTAAIMLAPGQTAFADLEAQTESAVRMVRKAITPQRDGSHLPLLFALRQLRDPSLKPFLQQLVTNDNWQMQVHAVLGLAEIDPARHIDPQLIQKTAPEAQESILATALDLKLLPLDLMKQILEWDGLQPMARLFLMAEMVSLKEPVNKDDLVKLNQEKDNHIAGLSACLLAQLGDDSALTAFRSHLAGVATDSRNEVILWLLEAVRRYHLQACAGWVKAVVQEPLTDPDVAYRGVFSLLEIDPVAGLPEWNRLLGDNATFQKRVRYGLVLLATSVKTASAYEKLKSGDDEELINRMIVAGTIIADGGDPSDALIQLLDLDHIKTTDWIMSYVEKIPREQASRVYGHLIDRAADDKPNSGDVISMAVRGVSKQSEIDPKPVLDRLNKAEDDSVMQQAILLGLFESNSPDAGAAAAKLKRIGSGKADSLALLLMAKHAKTLSDDDKDQLGKIAAGGGRLSEILQVQAAWLYLKHTGQTNKVDLKQPTP